MTGKRPTIAFVVDDLGFGGAQRQLSIVAEKLAEFVEPVVYCLSDVTEPFGTRLREKGISVVPLGRRSHFDVVRLGKLRKSLRATRPAVVHGFLDASNVYSYFATLGTGLPLLLSLRNERLRFTGVRARILGHAFRSADGILVNSAAGRRCLTDRIGVNPHKIFLVRNGVPVPPPGDDGTEESPSPVETVGFVGRLAAQKRIDLLLEGFCILRRTRPGARLVLLGDGPEKPRVLEFVREKGLRDAVDMPGALEDAAARMKRFTCLALPSDFEGTPNVALEALAAGVPVVARAVGDLEEMIIEGRTGILLRDGAPETLASALDRLIADVALRRAVRSEGPRLVAEKYSVDSAVERLRDVYRLLIEKS